VHATSCQLSQLSQYAFSNIGIKQEAVQTEFHKPSMVMPRKQRQLAKCQGYKPHLFMVSWLADKSSRTMLRSMAKASSTTSAPASLICTNSKPRSHCAEQCDSALGYEVPLQAESEHLGRLCSLTRSTQQMRQQTH